MSGNHISFDRLSRYHDGDFFPAAEKLEIEKHLESCVVCSGELEKLRRMVRMVACLGRLGMADAGAFAEGTVRAISSRASVTTLHRGARLVRKHFVPASAVAAIIVAVVGISIFSSDPLHNVTSRNQVARDGSGYVAPTQADPSARVMQMIRNSNATVLGVTGTCVLGETSPANLRRLRANLPGYRIVILDGTADRDLVAVSAGGGSDRPRVAGQGGVRFKVMIER
ncbi:MAG: zf-HC2 domain-containing protein [Spirochaetes bacterium]|nr:zf-HC2 domain-containing protein [Spirochaetota bacterium]